VHAAAGGVGLLSSSARKDAGGDRDQDRRHRERKGKASPGRQGRRGHPLHQDFVEGQNRITGGERSIVYDSVKRSTAASTSAPRGYMVLYGASSGPVPPLSQILNRRRPLFTSPGLAQYTTTARNCCGAPSLFSGSGRTISTSTSAAPTPSDVGQAQRPQQRATNLLIPWDVDHHEAGRRTRGGRWVPEGLTGPHAQPETLASRACGPAETKHDAFLPCPWP